MKKLLFLVIILALPAFGQNQSTDLRTLAGCGPADTKFDVKTDNAQHTVARPEAGKALVYVIAEERTTGGLQIGHPTTRVGLDGKWVGANHGSSYFSFAVDPGKHRVCSDWQSSFKSIQKLSGAADLNAEEGKTYFFRVTVHMYHEDHPAYLKLEAIDEAQGLLLISKSGLSTSTAKK